jgi:hypothetical protein
MAAETMTINNARGARAKAFTRKPAVAPISALVASKTRAISMLDANGDCCSLLARRMADTWRRRYESYRVIPEHIAVCLTRQNDLKEAQIPAM